MDNKIDIETIKNTKGIGEKTLQNIIDNHRYKTYPEMRELTEWGEGVKIDNITQGDSINVMQNNIPDNSIDMIITSPPYDDLREYNGYDFDYRSMMLQCYRVLKKGGVMVWVVGDSVINGSESGTSFTHALFGKSIGFNLHDTMIYEKNTSSFPASKKSNRYTQIFEYMFVFSKGKPTTVNLIVDKVNKWAGHTNWGKNTHRNKKGDLIETNDIKPVPEMSPRNNIWKYIVGGGFGSKDDIAYKHPATFPENLAEDHILTWSNKGDIILDPMCGSGTSCKMAKINDRHFIGIDVSKEYVNISKRRCGLEIYSE